MLEHLIHVNTWFPKYEVEHAEQIHYNIFGQTTKCVQQTKQQEQASLSEQIRNVRTTLNSNNNKIGSTAIPSSIMDFNAEQRLAKVEETHRNILQMIDDLRRRVEQIELNKQTISSKPTETKAVEKGDEDDDDFDVFGSDDDEKSEETKKRLEEYAKKKSNKQQVIAKSTIVLDVKPWDDETDLAAMEKHVRSIEADGLVWGQSKLIPVAFGVKKLQIGCVVEDDKIGTDFLEEKICEFEDFVQSVDIVSFNKI